MKIFLRKIIMILCGVVVFPVLVSGQTAFVDITDQAGVGGDPVNAPLSTSLAWEDFDGDGDLDLFVTNWGTAVGIPYNELYMNNDDGTFTNIVQESTDLGYINNSYAAAWGDYDNDGDPDLYIANFYEQDELLRNDGNGNFTNVTGTARIDITSVGNSSAVAWGDYDNDGDLDIYLGKYWGNNELYANNGNGSFSLVSGTAGVRDVRDCEEVLWSDYDGDGDIDLYVVNREQDNALYQNQGNGKFIEISGELGLNNTEIGRGGVWADYDYNEKPDLFLANIGRNFLYKNLGNGQFSEVGMDMGIAGGNEYDWESWDAAWSDYDGDGDRDLLVVGGGDSFQFSTVFFLNINDVFYDSSHLLDVVYNVMVPATGCGFGDYDRDGDPDIFITSYDYNYLLANQKDTNNFLKVRVEGKGTGFSNKSGIGAKIKVIDPSGGACVGFHEIKSCPEPLQAVFGLTIGKTYTVEVTFPNEAQSKVEYTVTVPADTTFVEE